MDQKDKQEILEKIIPRIDRGEISLLLGAGFSRGARTVQGVVPGTDELRDQIMEACGRSEKPNLKDAYLFGQKKISNFNEYLAKCFEVTETAEWQNRIFTYAWRRIYTTNIDNLLSVAHKNTEKKGRLAGKYTFVNYTDPDIVSSTIGTIPVISIHGTQSKLEDGFIFSSIEYAQATNKSLDWHRDLAAQMLNGGLVVIGNQLEESDIDSYLTERIGTYEKPEELRNWIVLPDTNTIKADNYRDAGYYVINGTAEEFFDFIYSNSSPKDIGAIITEYVPAAKIAVARREAAIWFRSSFNLVIAKIEDARGQHGILRHYLTGAHPDWLFIANDMPAEISQTSGLLSKISTLMESKSTGVQVLHVVGPSGSGKTSSIRSALRILSRTHSFIYEFKEDAQIDNDHLRDIISTFNSKSVFVFYSAAEYYYAVKLAHERFSGKNSPLCLFILEDRLNDHLRNRHQLDGIPAQEFVTGGLSEEDARCIVNQLEKYGVKPAAFDGFTTARKVRILLDKEKGYGGDLLSALFSLTSNENLERKIYQEFQNIHNDDAKKVLQLIAIIHSFGFLVPVDYVIGAMQKSPATIFKTLRDELAGIIDRGETGSLRCRHRVIADYYLENCIKGEGNPELVIDLLRYLSGKFSISDIKYHPLPYKVYKSVISPKFLLQSYLPFASRDEDAAIIYHEAQKLFSEDGIFWLSYGKYYKAINQLDKAIECFRVGLSHYESFQTKHALGSSLLEKYLATNLTDPSLYEEGTSILDTQRLIRREDPYPTTALLGLLIKISRRAREPSILDDCTKKIKSCINSGLQYFKDDEVFSRITQAYIKNERERGKNPQK
ncbi:TPA: SIR2 family protein [Stenotrophomonas maltophilia]|nr:SIR2 family protein [Stenotrophomonas maltophilia]